MCPPPSPVAEDMDVAVPLPQLQVVDNDVIEALRAKLANYKLDHKWETESVRLQHASEVQSLKALVDELIERSRVNNMQQSLQTMVTADMRGQALLQISNLDMEAMIYGYKRILRRYGCWRKTT